jgi:hypothetical protein
VTDPKPPAHRSHSQMSTLLWCGKQYQLSRIQRAPEVPSTAATVGRAIHATLEKINRYRFGEDA